MTLFLGKLSFLFGKQIGFLVTESMAHSIVILVVYGLLCLLGINYSLNCRSGEIRPEVQSNCNLILPHPVYLILQTEHAQ